MGNKCRVCNSNIKEFMSLGEMPIANAFVTKDNSNKQFFYHLKISFCKKCYTFQLIDIPKPEQMFNENYAYLSSTSSAMIEHFSELSSKIISNPAFSKNSFIVEVGSNDGIFLDQKIFVLVNRQSASASEVVAGAIQDNDRGIIVGRRTFGKGLVQQQFPLGGGDIIRLTTARYFTPTGRSIQRKYTSGNQLYFDEIDNRLNSEKIFRNEDFSIDDSIEFRTPKGKIVYGGGGIIPDVYVPRSENFNEQNFNENVINNFTFSFFDKYRDKLIVQNPKIFIKNPINDQEFVMKKFKDFCIENSIQMDIKKDKILNKIKAYLALYLYNKKAFFMILNKDDAVINKTLKMIEN